MDRLILFRHGKAEAESESGEDFDRVLAPRGEREAAQQGELLARMGFSPDLALVSTAARTQGTWAGAAASFPAAEMRGEPDLYNADSVTIRRLAERAGAGRGTVMVVGHNPGLQELALRLLIEGRGDGSDMARARHFPPGTAAVFRFDGEPAPTCEGVFIPEP